MNQRVKRRIVKRHDAAARFYEWAYKSGNSRSAHSGQYVTASPMSANMIRHVSPARGERLHSAQVIERVWAVDG